MDHFLSLRYFVKVIEAESFSAAAREFGVMPSSVTRAVSALEDNVGVPLLHRSTRRVAPTEAGRGFFLRSRKILAELDEARQEASGLGKLPRGRLRVSAPIALGQLRIMPLVPGFLARYPEIDIELQLTDAYIDLLAEGFDVAVRVGQEKESALMARKLCHYQRVLTASPAYLARHGAPRTPEDLVRHACLTFDYGPGSRTWYFKKGARAHEYAVGGPLHVNDVESIVLAAERGLGLCLLPQWAVAEQVRGGRLVRVLEAYQGDLSPTFNASLYAVFLSRAPAPKIRVFVDLLAEHFKS